MNMPTLTMDYMGSHNKAPSSLKETVENIIKDLS